MAKLVILLFLIGASCADKRVPLINVDEVAPWCIIGFDSEDRTPEQRISMLKELGLSRYGFNRGKGDLTTMIEEFQLAAESEIEITSVFLWLNAKRDSIGKLSLANQELLDNLNKVSQKPDIWVSFSNNFFKALDQEASINLASEMITNVKTQAEGIGCKLALYNHNGWFGNPYNQLDVLEALDDESISMVYNFHHAHEHINDFDDFAKKIVPYLSFVNLNGVSESGPKILTIGEGDHEYDMIKILKEEGYEGPWGILGHIKTEDVEVVLKRNINGLKVLNKNYDKDMSK